MSGEWWICIVIGLIAAIGYLCLELSRSKLMSAALCNTISAMLMDPAHATEIAEQTRRELEEKGLWTSGK